MELSNEVRDYLLEVAEIFGETISDIFDIHVEQITDGRHSKQDDLACESMSLAELDKLHELNMESYAELRRQLLAQAIKEYGFLNKNGRPGEYWLPFFSAIIPRADELDDNANIPALRRRQERMIEKNRPSVRLPVAEPTTQESIGRSDMEGFFKRFGVRRDSPFWIDKQRRNNLQHATRRTSGTVFGQKFILREYWETLYERGSPFS